MSITNNIITGTVNLKDDIAYLLNEPEVGGVHNLSDLCTSDNIKEWAKFKPLKIANVPNRAADWWKADGSWVNNCGFRIPFYNDGEDFEDEEWEYVQPTGGTYPYRELDFVEYDNEAICPIILQIPSFSYWRRAQNNEYDISAAVKLGAKPLANQSGNLSLSDLFPSTNNSNWYLGVEVSMNNSKQSATMSTPLSGSNTFSLEGCTLMRTNGWATITAFLTKTMQTTWGGWQEGDRYSLNAPGVTSSVLCKVEESPSNRVNVYIEGLYPEDENRIVTIYSPDIDGGYELRQWAEMRSRPSTRYILQFVSVVVNKVDNETNTREFQREDNIPPFDPFDPNIRAEPDIDYDLMDSEFVLLARKPNAFSLDSAQVAYYYIMDVTFHYEPEKASVTFDEDTIFVELGEQYECVANVTPSGADVEWYVTNEYGYPPSDVCSISYSGNVCTITGDELGTCRVYCRTTSATINDTEYVTVVVYQEGASVVTITRYPSTLNVNEKYYLSWSVSPEDTPVSWHSSDPSVLTVDQYGVITARSAGEGVGITCSADVGGGSDTVYIDVVGSGGGGGDQVTITLSPQSITLTEGDVYEYLEATVSSGGVTWRSSDESVATVDGSGLRVSVNAIGSGTASITVISKQDTSVSASCSVLVNQAVVVVPLESISLNHSSYTLSVGDTLKLIPTYDPRNATNKTIYWSKSCNPSNAVNVDNNGNVTAHYQGTARVTAVSDYDSSITAYCDFIITQPVESVELNKTSITIGVDDTFPLVATITPPNASYSTITWTSQDNSVATVSNSGVVRGIAVGRTDVEASCGKKSAVCRVNVEQSRVTIRSVYIKEGDITINIGDRARLSAVIEPDGAMGDISWTVTSRNDTVTYLNRGDYIVVRSLYRDRATVTLTVTENIDNVINTYTNTVFVTIGEEIV